MSPHPARCTGIKNPALIIFAALVLAACGGGGGNPNAVGGNSNLNPGGTPTTPAPAAAPTMQVGFVNSRGLSTNALSASEPLTVRALLRDKAGMPVPNALVTFTTDSALAAFTPSAGTRLTGSDGVASIAMAPASLAAGGAASVSATATVDGATITAQANYSVGATTLALGAVTLDPASIAAYGTTTVSVGVLANGAAYSESLPVSFTSACVASGKATMAASAPTNQGVAKVVYRDLGCGASDTISASVQGAARQASATLAIVAPAAASVQFASATPSNQSIVIAGQGGNLRTETATLKFRVFDIFNRPLPGQPVSFAVVPDGTGVRLNKASDVTDQNGEVITTVNSGSKATAFRVRASLAGGFSTLSDSIVVTTGLPVQRAFSVSVVTPNVEGLDFDSSPQAPATRVNVLVADEFGNPVADGTPVVFQTNLGSIGSSSSGGCNLVNGGCSVDFRSQNPRTAIPGQPATPCNTGPGALADSVRPGVATICASTTDGTNTVSGRTFITMSGSQATYAYIGNTRLGFASNTLAAIRPGDSREILVQLADRNLNPMPAGTTVQVQGLLNASATVAPETVPNIFADAFTSNDVAVASSHLIRVSAGNPTPCGANAVVAFSIVVTSPQLKSVSAYPITMPLTCP